MPRADAEGELQHERRARRQTAAIAPSSADSGEAARRDAVVRDIPEGTADGALEREAAKASGVVATVDGGLHCVGDRVDHGIHGRCVVCCFSSSNCKIRHLNRPTPKTVQISRTLKSIQNTSLIFKKIFVLLYLVQFWKILDKNFKPRKISFY
jgi:hypothetical protein